MALFGKECAKLLRGVTYPLLVVILIGFMWSQAAPMFNGPLLEPKPGENYGMKRADDPALVMPAAAAALYGEFAVNQYTTYPTGFIKHVKLSQAKREEMAEILSSLTEIPAQELLRDGGGGAGVLPLRQGLEYAEFVDLMESADKLLGGGSNYSRDLVGQSFGSVPVTYEEALAQYRALVESDKVTGAYARLFCDYLCIMAALLPVFPAIAQGMADKRARMRELAQSRQISSLRLILTRYAALVVMVMIPVGLLDVWGTVTTFQMYDGTGLTLSVSAFFLYSAGWVLPTVMMSAAVGMVLTELTDTPLAAAVMLFWWFVDLNAGLRQMHGVYAGLPLIPRHNTVGATQEYLDHFGALLAGRLFYAALALVLIGYTVFIYEQKRRGRLNGRFHVKTVSGRGRGASSV